jgi:hypothetical protein
MPWAGFLLGARGRPANRPGLLVVVVGLKSLSISPIRATTVSLQKAHSCDRHHIASATAVLASCLWIVPHMWFVLRSSKHSAPLTRGLFLYRQFPASPSPPLCSVHVDTTRHCPSFDGRLRIDHEIFHALPPLPTSNHSRCRTFATLADSVTAIMAQQAGEAARRRVA